MLWRRLTNGNLEFCKVHPKTGPRYHTHSPLPRRTSPGCKGEVAQYEGLTRYFVVNNTMGFLVGQRRKLFCSFLSPVKRSMENPEKGLLLLAEARQAQSRTHHTHKDLGL